MYLQLTSCCPTNCMSCLDLQNIDGVKILLLPYYKLAMSIHLMKFIMKTCPCNSYPLAPPGVYRGYTLLAHLSQRLIGELIGYPWSGVRRLSPSSGVRPQFQMSSPLKPLCQSKPNFMWSLLGKGERKFK